MKMNIYFIILACLNVMGIGIALGKHGEPRYKENEKYNFFTTLIASIIQMGLVYMAVKVGF